MRSTVPSTRTKPTRKRNLQEGQAIILIALLILVLFGMLGLAIDSGRGYVDRRDQQSAVDASALAAAISGAVGQHDRFSQMGSASRAIVEEEFSWSAAGAAVLRLYDELLA